MKRFLWLQLATFIVLMLLNASKVYGQANIPIMKCGDIIDSELTGDSFYRDYLLQVQAGTKLDLTIIPLGAGFNPFVFLVDPGGGEITRLNSGAAGVGEELLEYPISSTNATLRILGAELSLTETLSRYTLSTIMESIPNGYYALDQYIGKWSGAFTISLGCTLRDGTRIDAGQSIPVNAGNVVPVTPPLLSFGFPGLASKDFSTALLIPLNLGGANQGTIPVAGDAVLGFTFDAAAGDTFDLSFARVSGNLNLGLVVLSANNEVVFQASLVTSQTLNTRFTLPAAGQYTIGVFRVDLLPPAAPEATAFQVTGTLNP